MTRSTTILAFAAGLALAACQDTQPTTAPANGTTPAAASDAAAGPSASNAAAGASDATPPASSDLASSRASDRLLGQWSLVLSDEEKRQVQILQLALKSPAPTADDMAKLSLSEDEKNMVGVMAVAKAKNPGDPKITQMKAAADGLANATVTITPDHMTFSAGPVTEDATYTVTSQTDTTVTLSSRSAPSPDGTPAESRTATITFVDPNTIELVDGDDPSKKQLFTRKASR